MGAFLSFTITGIITGAVYAVAASGLVVTYTTSGIFNFAHGATGMLMAYLYWQLRVHMHLPAPICLILVLLIAAPLFGAFLERVLIRNIKSTDIGVSLVVTLGILLAMLGLANILWPPTEARSLDVFFGDNHKVKVGSVNVSWHQLTMLLTAGAVALFLRYLLFQTRSGVAMRAVVDDRDLTALNGARPFRISALSWAVGSSLAALAGILLAPQVGLTAVGLTFLVVDGFAAAMLGKLRSLPLTFAGAVILGLGGSYLQWKLPSVLRVLPKSFNDPVTALTRNLPTLFLFGVLVFLPQVRLKVGRVVGAKSPRIPPVRESIMGSGLLVVVCLVATLVLSTKDIGFLSTGLGTAIILLSLTLLAGYGGQVSLCQGTFVGIGAFVFGKLANAPGGSPVGLLVAAVVCAFVGALIALPALRLQGLYLALATLAFAKLADGMFFGDPRVLSRSALTIPRMHLFGLNVNGHRANFIFLAIAFGVMANLVLAIRRGPFGRLLGAMRDSPAACATLGLDLTVTKLGVFALSAAMAGVGGAILGSSRTIVVANDFIFIQSLVLLLLVTIGGVNTVTGALFGGLSLAFPEFINPHIPEQFQQLTYLGTGFGAIGLANNPIGVSGQIALKLGPLRNKLAIAVPRLGLVPDAIADQDAPPGVAAAGMPRGQGMNGSSHDANGQGSYGKQEEGELVAAVAG